MTGSLTILGGKVKQVNWDTDSPVSVEEARLAYETAIRAGGQPFDTTAETAARIDNRAAATPGQATAPEDLTVIPRYAGG